jgi:hypothetical protein
MAAALLFLANPAVASDLADIGLSPSDAVPISDTQMKQMRGGFVPANGAPVLFFGIVMQSTLQAQNGSALSAGAAFGVNLASNVPKIVTNLTWANQNMPGGNSGITPGTGSSVALSKLGSGVGQVVQIAGQGDQGFNQTSIDLTTQAPNGFLPTSAPSGTACQGLCQASVNSNGVQIGVNIPGLGSATQTINPQLILQGINLHGEMAQAVNTMNLYVQLGNSPAFTTTGINTVLQAIPQQIR